MSDFLDLKQVLCLKCFDEPIYNKKSHLGYNCYSKQYRKGKVPSNANEIWEGEKEYKVKDFKKLKEVKLNNVFRFDGTTLILVVPSAKFYQEHFSYICQLKKVFKSINFEVRDLQGNYITYYHDYSKFLHIREAPKFKVSKTKMKKILDDAYGDK